MIEQTRPADCEIDGVGIVTILNKSSGPELLLQKQYRPPIDKVVIEVPAGLIDAGETPEQCAVRELKEETGYVGEAEQISTVMYNGASWTSFLDYSNISSAAADLLADQTRVSAIPISTWCMFAWT